MALTKISGSILKDPLNLGEVSIGGTLTYQDVTNVDSVGIITARAGVDVSGGQLDVGSNVKIGNAGVATATNFKTGSSDLHSTGLTVGNNFLHSTGINVGTGATIHVPATNTLTLGTNSSERLRITSGGSVGIGTDSPNGSSLGSNTGLVHLNDMGSGNTALKVQHGSVHAYFAADNNDLTIATRSNHFMQFQTNSLERLRITSTGSLQHTAASGISYFTGSSEYLFNSTTSCPNQGGNEARVQVNENKTRATMSINAFMDNSGGPNLTFISSRSGTIGVLGTKCNNGDTLGQIRFRGDNATVNGDLAAGAQIQALARSTPADGDTVIAGELKFSTGSANGGSMLERLTISSGGLVGVGQASPTHMLHVDSSNASDSTATAFFKGRIIRFDGAASAHSPRLNLSLDGTDKATILLHRTNDDLEIQTLTASPIRFSPNSTERFRITSGGQLLLGETSAFDSNTATQFRYDNSGNTADFVFRNRANNSSSRVNIKLSTLNRAANADVSSGIEKYQNGGMAIYNGENTNQYSNINFFTNGWRSLQLRNGNHSGAWCAEIDAYWGTSNGLRMEVGGPQSGTWQAIDFHTSHTGTQRGYIGVTYGGVSYNSSSDYRMKQDVVDMTGAIDRIKSFLPKRFKWKEDPTHTVDGFLAHEAATVVPESVQGEKDGEQMQVMDNSKLVPVLTAALKEAIAKIEILETKVAALEGS